MARIDIIELNINGEDFKFNINVGKQGLFRVSIDRKVCKIIGLEYGDLEATTLSDLKSAVYGPYVAWLEATKTHKAFIGIEYKASRHFVDDANGHMMYGRHHSEKPFYDDATRFGIGSSIVFGYQFYIEETSSNGRVSWHDARKEDDDYELGTFEQRFQGFVFSGSIHSTDGKLIPYSEAAEATLAKGKEGLRAISEMLFNFVNQDEKLIEAALMNGNLLQQNN